VATVPAEVHSQKNLSLKKESSKIKMLESNRGEKEMVEENLTLDYDSVIIKKENKKVLDAYL